MAAICTYLHGSETVSEVFDCDVSSFIAFTVRNHLISRVCVKALLPQALGLRHPLC